MWLGLAVAGLLLPVYAATLAPGLSWANQGADGGDLITAAAAGGVAHPSGYPTYLLLARVWQWLPMGSLALRTNLLSAAAAALAAGLVVPIVSRAYDGPKRWGLAGGAAAGLALGLSPLLWSQAVITEVHALHTLFAALLFWTLPEGRPVVFRRQAHLTAGLAAGLALGNHLTTMLLVPAWLGLSIWQERRAGAWRLAGLGLGLLIYAYLPLAASTQPPVNWGGASSVDRFWWLVSGVPYQALAFGLATEFVAGRVQGWAGLLAAQFGWGGMVLALAGLFFGRTRGLVTRAMTLWTAGVCSAFAIGYASADSFAYLLPVFLAMAVWLGLGLATGLEWLGGWRRPALIRFGLLAGLGVALAVNAARTWPTVDASRDERAEAFGQAVMSEAPAGAVVVTQGDQDSFALWYFHFAVGHRPDIRVVVEPLLAFRWYQESLLAAYPDLEAVGLQGGGWRAELRAEGHTVCEARLSGRAVLDCAVP